MRSRYLIACILGVGLSLPAGALHAQTLEPTVPRPPQGLSERKASDQNLDVSVSMVGAYDDNLAAPENNPVAVGGSVLSGWFSGLTANAAYSKKFSHGEFAASEGSVIRYYPTVNDILSLQHAASVGANIQFGHSRLSVSQTFAYLPLFSFVNAPQLFDTGPAALPVAVTDQVTVRREERLSISSVTFSQQFGAGTSFSITANARKADFLHESAGQTMEDLGGRFSHHLTRDLSLVLGYAYQQGNYLQTSTALEPVHMTNIDAGIDYNHALGRTRRTTIGFTTGTATVQGVTTAAQRQFTGSARLNREIGRTWRATATYRRGAGLVDGFAQPLFADAVAVDVSGKVNRRFDVLLAGNYSKGEMGFQTTGSQNENYGGSARGRLWLSPHAALTAEYFLYDYSFAQSAVLPEGVPRSVNRQGARFGLELSLPVIR